MYQRENFIQENKEEKRLDEVKIKCQEAIDKINGILSQSKEERGKYGLGDEHFIEIRNELRKMKQILNKNEYKPIYGRFIIDFQRIDKNLLDYLLEISDFYEKYT